MAAGPNATCSAVGSPAADRPVSLRELEMQAILSALDRHRGNKPRAAEDLGISLKTLYNKLNGATSTGSTTTS
jgi:DNA-binding NtrC family response regulator